MFEDGATSYHFDVFVEVDCTFKCSVRTARIVVVKLFQWNTHFLNYIFFFDTGTEYIRFIKFNQFFHFVVAKVINNQCAFFHIFHQTVVVVEFETTCFQFFQFFFRFAGLETSSILCYCYLLDVTAIGINFDSWNYAATFVVITVTKLITCCNSCHAQLAKQFLIVVSTRSTYKYHGCFTGCFGSSFVGSSFYSYHFLSNYFFNLRA